MENIVLASEKRDALGKGPARRLRQDGMIPAVLYAKGYSTPLTIVKKEILSILRSEAAENSLINLEVTSNGKKEKHIAMVKEFQLDPVRNQLLHVDFMEVSMDKITEFTVPIHITHEPVGIKKGGVMEFKIREITIECLPSNIPVAIEVDASLVDIGGAFYVKDLVLPEGVKILADPKDAILTVSAKRAAVEEEEVEEAAPEETAEEEKAQE